MNFFILQNILQSLRSIVLSIHYFVGLRKHKLEHKEKQENGFLMLLGKDIFHPTVYLIYAEKRALTSYCLFLNLSTPDA